MSNKLKPCPFCGSTGKYIHNHDRGCYVILVINKLCKTFDRGISADELRSAWNTRTDPWLPYPKTKPPKDGYYLITIEDDGQSEVHIDRYDKGRFNTWPDDVVTAWMEEPKAYKKEGK